MFTAVRNLKKDWQAFPKGQIVNMTVWDAFSGEVKILKNYRWKWLVEIVDVQMCYPQQVPLRPGECLWIHQRDLFREI